jgi:MipA family protein
MPSEEYDVRYNKLFAVTISLTLLAPCALAEGESEMLGDPTRWGLGAGVAALHEPYLGIDDDAIAIPIVIHESRWVSIAGPVFDLKLGEIDFLSLRVRARLDPGAGYEAADSVDLAGMDERKAGLWLGASAVWKAGILDVGLEWLTDASDYSDGQRSTLSLQRRFTVRKISFTPRVEAVWIDRDNATYYYGVRAHEARAARGFYELDDALNYRLGVRADYLIANRHSLIFDVSATRLDSGIVDSPIVEESGASAFFFGYAYVF